MNEEELNKLIKDNPIKIIKCGDIEVPVKYLKQTTVTINGDYYIKLQQENKQLKHIIDELEKWLKERKEYYKSLHSQRTYAFNDTLIKLQELKGSDKE